MKGGARSVARLFASRDARRHLRTGGPNTSVLASRTTGEMGPRVAVDGSTTKAVFEAYLEQVLLLRPVPGRWLRTTSGPTRASG